jgi:pimeloyl-ACP methyl ester carboxylesterase
MLKTLPCRNGLQLAYADDGPRQAFPILVQHGLVASIADQDLFAGLLQHGARLVSLARPGYGGSAPLELSNYAGWADLAGQLVAELGLARFDLLGLSSGAPYAYSIASRFPEQVRSTYIFSGMPALYDPLARSLWPFPPLTGKSLPELQALAHEWFFTGLTPDALHSNAVRDSLCNNAFGVAQDLKLRFMDWGFELAQVRSKVYMRHSRADESVPYQAAVRTAALLPDCQLELTETGPHFSEAALNDFIEGTILKYYLVQ